jgi:hypothetical protein
VLVIAVGDVVVTVAVEEGPLQLDPCHGALSNTSAIDAEALDVPGEMAVVLLIACRCSGELSAPMAVASNCHATVPPPSVVAVKVTVNAQT